MCGSSCYLNFSLGEALLLLCFIFVKATLFALVRKSSPPTSGITLRRSGSLNMRDWARCDDDYLPPAWALKSSYWSFRFAPLRHKRGFFFPLHLHEFRGLRWRWAIKMEMKWWSARSAYKQFHLSSNALFFTDPCPHTHVYSHAGSV